MDIQAFVGLLAFFLYVGFVIVVAKFLVVSSWLDKHEDEPPDGTTEGNEKENEDGR